jgi:hypothetical protein
VKGTYTVGVAYGGDTTYAPANGSTSVVVALAPAGLDIETSGNQNGEPDNNDQIVYTYNQAMSIASIQGGWNGSQENVTAEFSRQGNQTQLAILCSGRRCNPINLGTVMLGDTSGQRYVNGFGNTVDLDATMAATTNGAGQTVITITLTESGGLSTVPGNTTLVWTPSGNVTNTGGVACATTVATEATAPRKNF